MIILYIFHLTQRYQLRNHWPIYDGHRQWQNATQASLLNGFWQCLWVTWLVGRLGDWFFDLNPRSWGEASRAFSYYISTLMVILEVLFWVIRRYIIANESWIIHGQNSELSSSSSVEVKRSRLIFQVLAIGFPLFRRLFILFYKPLYM